MFNKNLIKTLSTINPITNSIVLQYPVTYGVSEDHAISFKINVSEIDNDDFNDINLNDSLKDFISLFSLFNDFKCKEENGIFTITGEKNKADFILSDPVLMGAFKVPDGFFSKLDNAPTVANFDLDAETLRTLRPSFGVFRDSDCVSFNSLDNSVFLKVETNSRFAATQSNSYSLTVDSNPSKEFKIKISNSNISLLPLCDYKVEIKYSSKNDYYVVLLKTDDIPGFEVALAPLV